jgi:HAD superfamily hydrolase (TIGR01509 family)
MIKLVCFDMDGVLVDSLEIHYLALNMALEAVDPKYVIGREEHEAIYDQLPTHRKLKLLHEHKGLPLDVLQQVWDAKQKYTHQYLRQSVRPISEHQSLFRTLQERGFKVAVCSNAIRETIRLVLHRLDILQFVDFIFSNEDVKFSKPHPEIYQRAMLAAGVGPAETLILEDSHVGRTAAKKSGGHLLPIKELSDVRMDRVFASLRQLSTPPKCSQKWREKMNVLIPMAGAGSRFEKAGYTFPKPLIDVNGTPMIQVATDYLNIDARHIYIVQEKHYEKYNLRQLLQLISPGCEIIRVSGMTEGAACTTLLATDLINNDDPLLIANSDQYLEWDSHEFMYAMNAEDIDGGIVTFTATHPKWSFARVGPDGFVAEVAEKNPISDQATAGVYYWRKGSDYVKYAEQMIDNNVRVNNEFYVCPVFNEAIKDGKKFKTFHIEKMWGIGTPEDLNYYLNNFGK